MKIDPMMGLKGLDGSGGRHLADAPMKIDPMMGLKVLASPREIRLERLLQ